MQSVVNMECASVDARDAFFSTHAVRAIGSLTNMGTF